MSKRDDAVYLNDILDAIRQIETYLEGISYDCFRQDRMRRDAVVRQLEIIGEASRCLSQTFLHRHPEIPWQDIIGLFDVGGHLAWVQKPRELEAETHYCSHM
jgi:uncharacterized protein with HEPN domain